MKLIPLILILQLFYTFIQVKINYIIFIEQCISKFVTCAKKLFCVLLLQYDSEKGFLYQLFFREVGFFCESFCKLGIIHVISYLENDEYLIAEDS